MTAVHSAFRSNFCQTEVRDWVIVFTGAGMCDEYAFRCRNRSNTHTPYDADGMPIADKSVATLVEEGIFDPMGAINMVFADAHMVLVRDCSNDYWTGSTTEPKRVIADVVDMTAIPEDWVFNGVSNFMSVFEVLAERDSVLMMLMSLTGIQRESSW